MFKSLFKRHKPEIRVHISEQAQGALETALNAGNAHESTRENFWQMVNRFSAYSRNGVYYDLEFTDRAEGHRYLITGILLNDTLEIIRVVHFPHR